MRLKTTSSKYKTHFSIIKDYVVKGKRTTKIIENLGNEEQVKQRAGNHDYMTWINNYIAELNKLDQDENRTVTLNLNPKKELAYNQLHTFNGGYLFLQDIYYELGINKICDVISRKYKFTFDLNDILSRLVYSRIIYPASKLSTLKASKKFIEQHDFDIQHVYRALEVLAKEKDYIQAELYKNSLDVSKRNTGVLYYDLTNYFFEIETADDFRKYGKSKENRPNPLVQMGLFMDGDGIPLSFDLTAGNMNEQTTLKPLEKKLIQDFKLSKFVVCTDAGLASVANRKFNNEGERAFITTQSIKKLKNFLKQWALDQSGWRLSGSDELYNINEINEDLYKDSLFYKERWIKENDFEQRLIVTYSIKYKNYHQKIRLNQIERASKLISNNPAKLGKVNQNDFRRFISKTSVTSSGEEAMKNIYELDMDLILEEAAYDGLYGVCTNLEDNIEEIIKVNRRRWEMEESFRIMKSEFEARPVYLSREDRITAHFVTCVLALIIYRYLEKRLEEKYTTSEIMECLRDYNFREFLGDGYVPSYTRTNLIDTLHKEFGFRTDFDIVSDKKMKKICKETKS